MHFSSFASSEQKTDVHKFTLYCNISQTLKDAIHKDELIGRGMDEAKKILKSNTKNSAKWDANPYYFVQSTKSLIDHLLHEQKNTTSLSLTQSTFCSNKAEKAEALNTVSWLLLIHHENSVQESKKDHKSAIESALDELKLIAKRNHISTEAPELF